jgi:ABC-2 type transport system permease protein
VRVRAIAAALATVAALFVLVSAADAHHHLYDLTTNNALTLTPQTRAVLRRVETRVDITALLGPDDPGRSEAAALLERYHRANRHVRYRVVDPDDAPTLVRSLAVDPTVDVLAAARGKSVARAPTVTEQDVTSVLAQVDRGVDATLCFTTGHGESDVSSEEPEGLAAAARLLESNGYKTKAVDLLTQVSIPSDCDGLVVAAPTAELASASEAIRQYLRGNGRALVMSDPVSTLDLSPLLDRFGLSFDRGITFDTDTSAHLPDDVATLIVRSYRSTNPAVRGLPPTLFPGTEAVDVATRDVGGLSTTALVQTGGGSFLDRHPERVGFTKGEDAAGPITLVAAADRSRVAGPNSIERARVVATSDVDFATNAFIAEGGNARLLVQTVDWLTTQEDLVPLNANLPPYRPLPLTRARTASARVLSVGVVPGAFLLAGLLVWVVRRRA